MNDIQDLKNNDQHAFNQVFNRYHHRLYNYIFSKTRSEYLAEETVQLTFIKLWDKRKSLSAEVALSAQIFRIANTTLVDLIRSMARKDKSCIAAGDTLMNDINEALPGLFLKETQCRLEALIASLPPVRRQVFRMSRFEEMSHKEISEALHITPKTVENHINLALKYIKPFFFCLLCFWIY